MIVDEIAKIVARCTDGDAQVIAESIVEGLGLTEFECDGERWWSTKYYPTEEG